MNQRQFPLRIWIGIFLVLLSLILLIFLIIHEIKLQDQVIESSIDANQIAILPLQVKENTPLPNSIETNNSAIENSVNGTPEFIGPPTPIATAEGLIPDRISIESIQLDAPITPVHFHDITIKGTDFIEWDVPNEFAAGWHDTSAKLGELGNIVLNGHNNIFGDVFANLRDLKEGDLILIFSGNTQFLYQIEKVIYLKEKGAPVQDRIQNASWIGPSDDERLTLVSCWPPSDNKYRIIVVAFPVDLFE